MKKIFLTLGLLFVCYSIRASDTIPLGDVYISQIINDTQAVCYLRGQQVMIENVDFSPFVDGMTIRLKFKGEVVGKYVFTTVLGTRRTIMIVRAIEPKKRRP